MSEPRLRRRDAVREQLFAAPLFIWLVIHGLAQRSEGWWGAVQVGVALLLLLPGCVLVLQNRAPRVRAGLPPTPGSRWLPLAGNSLGCVLTAVAPGPRVVMVGLALCMAVFTVWLLRGWPAPKRRAEHD